ncbi:MAG TPA: hypothetical protein VGS06_22825 [Streptosporangiaceae bacterium]|nr:hypothetical protein [Streptosporangiaceae bacterium]HEV2255993.1 hypothetical protein [Streptosporangiaceae bacterium]
MTKLPQQAVYYRLSTDPARRCDACIMYRDRACTRVEGPIDPGGTCDIFYPARMAEAAAEAYLAGWALTEAPYTNRVHAGLTAAVALAGEHQHDPGVLEVSLQLGHLTGAWQTIYDRRERLQVKHERAILAAWRACLAALDPADLARRYRLAIGQHGETTDPDRRWWQDTGIAAAAAWLAGVYRADGYDTLVTALANAIRAGMAEGEAGALALAASKLGRTGFRIDKAFKAAYKRLAGDQTISRQAAQAATRLIDAAAAAAGRRLAAVQGDSGSEQDMTAAVKDATDNARSVRQVAGDVFWTAMGAGALSLFGRASQPPPGSSDSGVTVLIDWNSEPSACIICQDNTAGGPYAPQDVPPYLAHPNCRCWLSAASGLPAWMLASWLAGDD